MSGKEDIMFKNLLIQKDPKIVLREEFDQWGILFNPDTSAAVSINGMGIDIWKLTDGICRLERIIETIQKEYDQVPDEAIEQIYAFFNELIEKGFIKSLPENEENEKS